MSTDTPSAATSTYIDIETLTSPTFSPYAHAATLIQRTNNQSDPSIDLNTPLSRALFDLQEIDSHIHTLTSRSALDILTYTQSQNAAAQRILSKVEEERTRLNESYGRLEKEVLGRYERATEAKVNASRSWELLRLIRSVQRILNVARQFETAIADSGLGAGRVGKEDHRAILRASYSLISFRGIMSGPESAELGRINLIKAVRGRIFEDGEARILDFARRVVREFAMSSLSGPNPASTTFRDAEDYRARFISAVHILYLMSPAPQIDGRKMMVEDFEPEYLLRALQSYLQSAITSSSAAIGRALGQLPTLEKTLIEVSARCQNVVALEVLLRGIKHPEHPLLRTATQTDQKPVREDEEEVEDLTQQDDPKDNFLVLLLQSLDTASLPSYFWRSLASSLSARVHDVLNRGGVAARTLRNQRDTVRNEIRDCVLRGSRMPQSALGGGRSGKDEVIDNWEREAAVMVGSVVSALGR